jgi:hypothetical protein
MCQNGEITIIFPNVSQTIEDESVDGWVFEGIEKCRLKFSREVTVQVPQITNYDCGCIELVSVIQKQNCYFLQTANWITQDLSIPVLNVQFTFCNTNIGVVEYSLSGPTSISGCIEPTVTIVTPNVFLFQPLTEQEILDSISNNTSILKNVYQINPQTESQELLGTLELTFTNC